MTEHEAWMAYQTASLRNRAAYLTAIRCVTARGELRRLRRRYERDPAVLRARAAYEAAIHALHPETY